MIVEYRTKKIKTQCEDPRIAQKDYGSDIGNKLTQRVEELLAATSLLDIKHIPSARLHRLQGARSDQYAIDLVHPHRLVIKPLLEDNGDINKLEIITIVRIEEVKDYHGKQKR
jgi:proteic killer suppression protein